MINFIIVHIQSSSIRFIRRSKHQVKKGEFSVHFSLLETGRNHTNTEHDRLEKYAGLWKSNLLLFLKQDNYFFVVLLFGLQGLSQS